MVGIIIATAIIVIVIYMATRLRRQKNLQHTKI
jgi:uncharacterized protein YoxC